MSDEKEFPRLGKLAEDYNKTEKTFIPKLQKLQRTPKDKQSTPRQGGWPSPVPIPSEEEYQESIGRLISDLIKAKDYSLLEIGCAIENILRRYSVGELLKSILPDYNLSRWQFRNILYANPHWYGRMNLARETHMESLLEDARDIVFNDTHDSLTNSQNGSKYMNKEYVARSNLKFEYIKWSVEKLSRMKLYTHNADSTLEQKAQQITSSLLNQEISAQVATEYLRALDIHAKVVESHDIAYRVRELEEAQKNKR